MTPPQSGAAGPMQVLAWLRQALGELRGRDLQLDSRRVRAGDVFVALPGARTDGRRFVEAASRLGAAAVLVEADGWEALRPAGELHVPVLPVPKLARLLGPVAARFYGHPSERLVSIGVTGTNGKTSCSQWIAQLLALSGVRCAVIGTLGSGFPGAALAPADLTTPDAAALQRELRRLVDDGAQALAMEVSSIGLDQGRVAGMTFDVALFTNLTRDHLDYHGTMARYEQAKAALFDWPTLTHAVVNLDDPAGDRIARRLAGRAAAGALRVIGYTQRDGAVDRTLAEAVLRASAVRGTAHGLAFEVELACGDTVARAGVQVPLLGTFNASNLLGVLGVVWACGVDFETACRLAARLTPPPGRLQPANTEADAEAPLAVVDYAHTPDALAQALDALRPLARARGGELWVLFGAGGDRDPGKRAPMGAAAASGADRVVITSDNPRSEDPAAIVAAIERGLPAGAPRWTIVERAEAIATAIARAGARDVVLIAGKGHEAYQEAGGRRLPFSDLEQARAALAQRRAGAAQAAGPAGAAPPAGDGTGRAAGVLA